MPFEEYMQEEYHHGSKSLDSDKSDRKTKNRNASVQLNQIIIVIEKRKEKRMKEKGKEGNRETEEITDMNLTKRIVIVMTQTEIQVR